MLSPPYLYAERAALPFHAGLLGRQIHKHSLDKKAGGKDGNQHPKCWLRTAPGPPQRHHTTRKVREVLCCGLQPPQEREGAGIRGEIITLTIFSVQRYCKKMLTPFLTSNKALRRLTWAEKFRPCLFETSPGHDVMNKWMGRCNLISHGRRGTRAPYRFGAGVAEPALYPPVLCERQPGGWLRSKLCLPFLGPELRQGRKMSIWKSI